MVMSDRRIALQNPGDCNNSDKATDQVKRPFVTVLFYVEIGNRTKEK